uniref:Tyr recombinase domain-containing protein n=1 Tax=Magallana gigas TaxID=29159 RepID=A0A8W8P187_MAGGI
MPKRKATHAHVGPARGDRPKRKQATTPAPAEPPVPALGLTDEQLRHLAEEVASRIEPRIGAPSAGNTPSMVNIPTMDNIPANLSDPFEPEPGVSSSLAISLPLTLEATLFTAIFVTAFYGYFRIGELVQNSITDIGHAVQLEDITFGTDNKSVTINLKHSKTDQERSGAVVNIKSVDKHLCPVFSLRKFLRLRPKALGSLFCHVDGALVTRYQTASVFNQSLVRLGLDTQIYKLHSFRIGAATHAWSTGKGNEQIAQDGRWTSNCLFSVVAGNGGMKSHQLIRKVRTLLKYEEAPSMLVIHCGGNDIGQILKFVELRATIKRILDKLVVLLPNTILVWSQILPRLHWRGRLTIKP